MQFEKSCKIKVIRLTIKIKGNVEIKVSILKNQFDMKLMYFTLELYFTLKLCIFHNID